MRAGTQFTASSTRAAARPKAWWRGERWPIMLSIGVDRLVGEEPRQAEQQVPEGGRDHTVGIVLGTALDRRAGDAVAIERADVAANDVTQAAARAGSMPLSKSARHPHHVIGHGALREHHRHTSTSSASQPHPIPAA